MGALPLGRRRFPSRRGNSPLQTPAAPDASAAVGSGGSIPIRGESRSNLGRAMLVRSGPPVDRPGPGRRKWWCIAVFPLEVPILVRETAIRDRTGS